MQERVSGKLRRKNRKIFLYIVQKRKNSLEIKLLFVKIKSNKKVYLYVKPILDKQSKLLVVFNPITHKGTFILNAKIFEFQFINLIL